MTVDVEAVAAAAKGCPLVAGLAGGRFGDVATYLPGRRIVGVRQADGALEVHVVARWGTPLPELAEVVRVAITPYAGELPVAVFIDDIELPGDASPAELTEASVAAP
ncbi:MAG TPA: hypothetical protein VMZ73_00760 [Acidimicrobiales bacterium]|nr:hypothetical protein [Acidimicrobiales bacterium]